MATWSLLQNIADFDYHSVCSDGNRNIYYIGAETTTPNVFKYDANTDTIAQISTTGSWAGTSPGILLSANGSSIQYFKGDVYAVIATADGSDNLRVFKYSGSGTSWTQVFSATLASPVAMLFCTASDIILAPGVSVTYFDWAYYSADGSSWLAATVDSSKRNTVCALCSLSNLTMKAYGQGVTPIFGEHQICDGSCDPPYQAYEWFEWVTGAFTVTYYTQAMGASIFDPQWTDTNVWLRYPELMFIDVTLWTHYSGDWQYQATLGNSWLTPGNNSPAVTPIVTIGPLNKQAGRDGNYDLTFLESGSWSARETFGEGTFSHLVVLSDGRGFIFGDAPGTKIDGIWGRSEPFPVVGTTASLYIYKTTDHGDSWAVKKVET